MTAAAPHAPGEVSPSPGQRAATDPAEGVAAAELRLPRPPGVFRRWLAAHPRVIDGFIVACYLVGCALVIAFDLVVGAVVPTLPDADVDATAALALRGAYLTWPWLVVSVLIIALTAVALAYRRRFPVAGVILVSAQMILDQGLLILPNSVALVFLLYAVPVYRSVRAGWIAFGIALVATTAIMQLTAGTGTGVGPGLLGPEGFVLGNGEVSWTDRLVSGVVNGLWLLAALMIGINLGNRRRYVDALIDRAHQLAREQEQRAQLAASAERARIARELHDIVAHSLSVVVTLSEAAAVVIDTQPAAAKQALERSAETGRSALAEMRRLLGVLNDESERSFEPQPGLAELPRLVEGFTDAGLEVTVSQQGVPAGDPSQQLAVYRIVQEALTNALRHAGRGAEVEVELRHEPGVTRITVADSGRVAGRSDSGEPALPGSGRGLEGARQRAHLFGGELTAGPRGAGWQVVATVPIGASPIGAAPTAAPAVSQPERTEDV